MKKVFLILIAVLVALAGTEPVRAQQSGASPAIPAPVPQDDYVIGVGDTIAVAVLDSADMTGKFTVQPEGTITLPLIGRFKVLGLTPRAVELGLTRALADGFINDPHVTVTLEQYRGKRIFIFGAVSSPGAYPMPEGQTLIEALVRAGYAAASQVVIVRPKQPSGPTMPEDAGDADVIRINLKELEKDVENGSLARNVRLRDGDTVFVPRTDPTRIFVSGQVRNPGAYSITENTTVLQALALAGGPTEGAAINRLRIMRIVNGKQKTFNVKITDIVQPGDTLVVPERYL
jgi:polysaccharide export outer membrane protein